MQLSWKTQPEWVNLFHRCMPSQNIVIKVSSHRKILHSLVNYYCEVRWYFFILICSIQSFFKLNSLDERGRSSGLFFRSIDFLQRTLKKYPYWIQGHGRLGMTEVLLQELSERPLAPLGRARIRLSSLAIRNLCESHGFPKGSRADLEAHFLEAELFYYRRDFIKSLELYSFLARCENSSNLHVDTWRIVKQRLLAISQLREDQSYSPV